MEEDPMNREPVWLFGCRIDPLSTDEAVAQVEGWIAARDGTHQSAAVNFDQLIKAKQDPKFRRTLLESDQLTADGQPLVWLTRLFGQPVPERVSSIDLMLALMKVAEIRQYRVYLLGAKPEALSKATLQLQTDHPGLRIVGQRNGYFNADDETEIVADIVQTNADILLIAISSPKKEEFVSRHRQQLGVPFVLGVGGAFDVLAGIYPRAPVWMRRAGLEWTWRVAQEPRRLLPRLAENLKFSKYILEETIVRIRHR